jgi:hypothetical protein
MKRLLLSRRAFAAGLGSAAAAGLLVGRPLLRFASAQEDAARPKRLLIIHKPCGTVPANYLPQGASTEFTLSRILSPFESLRQSMIVLTGLDIKKKQNTPGQDHGNGMVTFMTGGVTIQDPAFTAVIAERESIDQILARDTRVSGSAPFASVQLAADIRSDRDEVFTRVLSYSGRAAPLPPEHRPASAFAQVFGELMPGGATPENIEALERARQRKRSVLDFLGGSLGRLSARAPAEQRPKLETHLVAVRELERALDVQAVCGATASTAQAAVTLADTSAVDDHHGEIGLAQLEIIRAAFQCDLTRVATFMWASGNSHINFSRTLPGVENAGHHAITHNGVNREDDETRIHEWYCQKLAGFLNSLRETPDGDGSLLDNTLIVVFSEITLGKHTFDNVPIQIFGGKGTGLQGGRVLDFGGRSTNDLWLAIAAALGAPLESFGDSDKFTEPLSGIFDAPA